MFLLDDEESDASSPAEETIAAGRRKFDDEEDEDDVSPCRPAISRLIVPQADMPSSKQVLDSWDAAEDSEVEREKAKKAAEAKAAAEAEAKANKKSKTQRVAEKIAERQRAKEAGEDYDSDEETESQKKERLRAAQKEADLKHAEDLFGGDVGSVPSGRRANIKGSVVPDPNNPDNLIDLATMPLFTPKTKAQFEQLREVLAPLVAKNAKAAHYTLFLTELAKQMARDMPSDQIKKVASALTTLSNEKMKEEKSQQGGGKKTKAAKTKTTLAVGRPAVADTTVYDEEAFGDDDFM